VLSEIDLNIIGYLSNDPRCSVTKMAEDLAMPESTVRHRLNRILQTGLIEFAAIVDPLQFGFNTWTIMEIQADLNRVEAVGERLATFPEVYFVGLTTGGYDLLVGAVFRSTEELSGFVTTKLANIPGIVRTSTSSVLKVFKRTSAFGLLRGLPLSGTLVPDIVGATKSRRSRARRPAKKPASP
jgi:Lrp/AsnC family transcriptional regulator for asnA, asnC and gidA